MALTKCKNYRRKSKNKCITIHSVYIKCRGRNFKNVGNLAHMKNVWYYTQNLIP